MPLILRWLRTLAKSKTFQAWLLKELGPGALTQFRAWTSRVRHRQAAIDHADQIDGRFSVAMVDGERHVVVWKDGIPIDAYPPVEGDLADKLREHTREDLRHPDDLHTRRARRWVSRHIPTALRRDAEDPQNETRADRTSPEGERLFQTVVERLPQLLEELGSTARQRVSDHPLIPALPGIYLFHHNGAPAYVGQTRNLRTRLAQHTAAGGRQNQASFAFNLAKRSAQRANLNVTGFRAKLEADPEFARHFERARKEVAEMDVQFIELEDPIARTLFEVYAALALGTAEFNSFETH
jgi:hypothetical protein